MPQTETRLNKLDPINIGLELTYMALPLLIYILFFLVVVPEKDWAQLSHKPEWMFIALLYSAENLRDSVEMYGNARGARTGALQATLVLGILLLILTGVVLFAVLGAYEGAFTPSRNLYTAQWSILVCSLVACGQQKVYKRRLELGPRLK